MSITVSPFTWFSKSIKHIDLSTLVSQDIKVALISSAYTPNITTHEYFDVSISGELVTANGYTNGGQSLTSKTLTSAVVGSWVFSSANPMWAISSASLVSRMFVLYNNTPSSNKPLLGYGYLNYNAGIPLDVTTGVGYSQTIIVPANGWFQINLVNGV